LSLDGRHLGVDPQVDTVLLVEESEDASDLRPQDADQRQIQGFQDRDLGSRAPCGRGYFQADPATSDDRESTPRAKHRLDAVRVLHRAQVGHRRSALIGHPQATWRRARGDQQLVVDLRLFPCIHGPPDRIKAGHQGA